MTLLYFCVVFRINSQNSANTTSILSRHVTESTPLSAIFTFVPEIIRPNNNFFVYVSIFLGFILCGFLRSVMFSLMTSRIARILHDDAYTALMRAPLSFFERNPVSKLFVWSNINYLLRHARTYIHLHTPTAAVKMYLITEHLTLVISLWVT